MYLKERNGDDCPWFSKTKVCELICKNCPVRGTMWIGKDGKMTIQCKADKEDTSGIMHPLLRGCEDKPEKGRALGHDLGSESGLS